MIRKFTDMETLYICSMGKILKVSAIATSDYEANQHMEKYDSDAVVAETGPFIFMANKYDKGLSRNDS